MLGSWELRLFGYFGDAVLEPQTQSISLTGTINFADGKLWKTVQLTPYGLPVRIIFGFYSLDLRES
jgi:hypothetical protein